MASVWGQLRGSSLDLARTALSLIRTGTQHTLGPVWISCLGQKDGKENGQFTMIERKRQAHQRTHLSQRKIGPDCFCFCFFLHLSFLMVKGIKTTRKIKEKEKRSPDPGHYWPDTDSGPGSGPYWPGFWFLIRTRIRIYGSESGAALTHGLFGLFADFLRTFYRLSELDFIPGRYARCVCVKRGGTASVKSGLK
jgi:hypothetical protein